MTTISEIFTTLPIYEQSLQKTENDRVCMKAVGFVMVQIELDIFIVLEISTVKKV